MMKELIFTINNLRFFFLSKYEVKHRKALAYHPQMNGEKEVLNRKVKYILEKTVNSSRNN
jgi:hypothetical protein